MKVITKISIILIPAVFLFLVAVIYIYSKGLVVKQIENVSTTKPSMTVKDDKLDFQKKSNLYYKITISKQPTFTSLDTSIITWYLDKYLFENTTGESQLFYEIREKDTGPYATIDGVEAKYNKYPFFLLSPNALTKKVYEDNNLRVEIDDIDSNLEPYLQSTKYCETTSDCSIRYSFCTIGSYNKYEKFHDVWGCGPLSNFDGEDSYPEAKVTATKCIDSNGFIDVTYSGSECINNICTPLNPTVKCEHFNN